MVAASVPIPPLKAKRRKRRVAALDVFMKSDLKRQLVTTPRFTTGPNKGKVDLATNRKLSKIAFDGLDIAQKAGFQAKSDELNRQNAVDELEDAGSEEEVMRAL